MALIYYLHSLKSSANNRDCVFTVYLNAPMECIMSYNLKMIIKWPEGFVFTVTSGIILFPNKH